MLKSKQLTIYLTAKTDKKIRNHCMLHSIPVDSFVDSAIELALKIKLHESVEADKVRREERVRLRRDRVTCDQGASEVLKYLKCE